jgi:replicative DNA helicase Mcm
MPNGSAEEDGMENEPQTEIIDRDADWSKFLRGRYRKQLSELSREFPYRRSLFIDYRELESFGKTGIRMADELLGNPGKVIGDVRSAIGAHQLIKTKDGKAAKEVNIRFINLPRKVAIRGIRSDHINTFISVEGILRKTTEVRPRVVEAHFRCPGGHITIREQGYGKFREPDGCAMDGCTFKKLELIQKRSRFIDSQKLRIQESPEGLRGGEQPQTLDVDATDDLTGKVAPGDRVIMNGILRSMQRVSHGEKSTIFDIYLECNSIEIAEKEFEEVQIEEKDEDEILTLSRHPNVYGKIIHSIAPTIYGNEDVKEAIALQLFGGITKEMPDGSHLRGDIHVLLIGDPGIAKSQLLRYVVKLSPRAIYTSGQSSTSAGLTATAVKDEFGDGRWTLEAGALVLADMGIAAVDEMDKMQKEDRAALHEAMEQQSISVAKAGITATLKSRCALLGAANPKYGRFDDFTPIGEQINMPASLLSRFDLIFIMGDKPNPQLDGAIAEHILKAHSIGETIAQHAKSPIPGVDDEYIQEQLKPVTPDIEPVIFRKYVAYAKRTCFPRLSDAARQSLVDYYMRLRGLASESNKPVPVTARQLEALVRLAEASARIRLSSDIELADAERVINIVDTCLRQVAYDAKTGTFDIDKVVTGFSKGKRDLIRTIKEVIRQLADESGRAQIDDVIDQIAREGHPRDEIRKQIDMFLRQGEAMEPKPGIIKLI